MSPQQRAHSTQQHDRRRPSAATSRDAGPRLRRVIVSSGLAAVLASSTAGASAGPAPDSVRPDSVSVYAVSDVGTADVPGFTISDLGASPTSGKNPNDSHAAPAAGFKISDVGPA